MKEYIILLVFSVALMFIGEKIGEIWILPTKRPIAGYMQNPELCGNYKFVWQCYRQTGN